MFFNKDEPRPIENARLGVGLVEQGKEFTHGRATDDPNRSPELDTAPSGTMQASGGPGDARTATGSLSQIERAQYPSGALGDWADHISASAPHQSEMIALGGSIGILAGVVGKSYVSHNGAGLNVYALVVADTGMGKEAISSGANSLFKAASKKVPAIYDFKLPGDFASAPSLVKTLVKQPCGFSIWGECGAKLGQLSNPKAPPNDAMLRAVVLDVFGKSGPGNRLEARVRADDANSTAIVESPALSIIGEGTPADVYGAMSNWMISSGLLPRFMVLEHVGPRRRFNRHRRAEPLEGHVSQLVEIGGYALKLQGLGQVVRVGMTPNALKLSELLSDFATDEMNKLTANETSKQLWNRVHLNSDKLASLKAVGDNYINPIVTEDDYIWASTLVITQTRRLLGRFESGEVGTSTNDEAIQLQTLILCIANYMVEPFAKYEKYGGKVEMHKDHIILKSFIQRRLSGVAVFAQDKAGAKKAIERAISTLMEGDELRIILPKVMDDKYKVAATGYGIFDPRFFIEALRIQGDLK